MNATQRRFVLRANAIYLGVAAVAALLLMDLPGILFGRGPAGAILAAAPYAGVGMVEAHSLALILAVLLWRAAPARAWHLTALAVELPLGIANLAFWQIFVATDSLPMGYVTTTLHWTFVALQLLAIRSQLREDSPLAGEVLTPATWPGGATPFLHRRGHGRLQSSTPGFGPGVL